MTFKQLVKMINEIETKNELNEALSFIDRSYDKYNKISYADHELLYSLACKLFSNNFF